MLFINLLDCARDTKIYEQQGTKITLKCSQNGNYAEMQTTRDGKYYCVDSSGFPTTEEVVQKPDCATINKYSF